MLILSEFLTILTSYVAWTVYQQWVAVRISVSFWVSGFLLMNQQHNLDPSSILAAWAAIPSSHALLYIVLLLYEIFPEIIEEKELQGVSKLLLLLVCVCVCARVRAHACELVFALQILDCLLDQSCSQLHGLPSLRH